MLAAVLQMNSGADQTQNLDQAYALLYQAARAGANLAVLPEYFSCLLPPGQAPQAEHSDGPAMSFLRDCASELGLWIAGGTINLLRANNDKPFNACPVLDPEGTLRALYYKIHLFDLNLPGSKPVIESSVFRAGRKIITTPTPWGIMGLAVCYDLRFPELFRRLWLKGAYFTAVPAAFNNVTGRAHWELLLKARAVENQFFVLAAAQCGQHAPGCQTHGNAMIVDPWGKILTRLEHAPGLALAELDFKRLSQVRDSMNCLAHARLLPKIWYKEI